MSTSDDGLIASFQTLFGREPTASARAHGRVNLIGDHTDYNDGFVLPAAIPLFTLVQVAPRDDVRVRAWSSSVPAEERWREYELGGERLSGRWSDFIEGVTRALAPAGLRGGFDLRVESTIPLGAGLSSSAALEVAVIRALDTAYGLGLDSMAIAHLAHDAEVSFVGVPVGLLDQMAVSLAHEQEGLFIDMRSFRIERYALPSRTSLIVIDSGIVHQHASGDYRVRRSECERAATLLGVKSLRDLASDDGRVALLEAPLNRRVRHVLTENARVLEMCSALRAADPVACGRSMDASHESLRDDFEVSLPQIDVLVACLCKQPGVFGARLTGGGFGGSVVALASQDRAHAAAVAAVSEARRAVTIHPRILLPIG
jgi:galactokinase